MEPKTPTLLGWTSPCPMNRNEQPYFSLSVVFSLVALIYLHISVFICSLSITTKKWSSFFLISLGTRFLDNDKKSLGLTNFSIPFYQCLSTLTYLIHGEVSIAVNCKLHTDIATFGRRLLLQIVHLKGTRWNLYASICLTKQYRKFNHCSIKGYRTNFVRYSLI